MASGDVAGNVKVWDCVGEGVTKGMWAGKAISRKDSGLTVSAGDYAIIAGRINDLAWDGDSQRIIAVGAGKERMGHCISADSGNSVGEISGHAGQINSVSIRPTRPLRAATGSDDTSIVFYHGAPFKFNTSLRGQHDRFVFGTAFSPDGASLVSVGADRRVWLYDGKTGEVRKQLGEGVHTGSVLAVSWAADSKRFVTASADQTVRVWDVEAGKNTQTWRMGEEGAVSIGDQQVGVVWPKGRSDGLIVSVDLDGNLNYLVEGSPRPTRVVCGHQKNVTAATIGGDSTLWTGSSEGRVCAWDLSSGVASRITGEKHTNYISGITCLSKESNSAGIYTAAWDDTLRTISPTNRSYRSAPTSLPGQPKGLTAAASNTVLVATSSSIELLFSSAPDSGLRSFPLKYSPTALAASGTTVAVGSDDKTLRIYTLSTSSPNTSTSSTEPLTLTAELRDATAPISALAFSPRADLLAAGTATGKIYVYKRSDDSNKNWTLLTSRWSAHTARVTGIAWRADGLAAASGSLDTSVCAWSVAEPGKRIAARNAHKDGVGGVVWEGEGEGEGERGRVVSFGADASLKVWRVEGI